MVVLKVDVDDLVVLDPEGDPPVTGDVQAPCAVAVAGQNLRFPCGKGAQLLGALRRIEECQHLAELVHGVRAHALRGIVLVQPAQTRVRNTPYFHMITVTLRTTVCQWEHIPDVASTASVSAPSRPPLWYDSALRFWISTGASSRSGAAG